ncbi:tRNA glutamyl-Q(34) synthetase GluQRS [Endozoicomonas sp. SCSIO W0465]|uniref:tRNA glutamyl-Q(34) synthetase GluQRS n=1 Tax=Endozoicomonas sp. SCSIO W0465 TaxID=2918516 RepID=UPI0020758208|nr:tRNA glutamyl-Q(34) synthetase GluQRS [Endozoicomonas sp. SCSIO W0465]USE37160.1 tRNA glutamyl-Q(34) synthetase GluQRS [Endozoicomonas sp. SCSIO W0465]
MGDKLNIPPYIGRFAPSPSGPLHFGSLVAALASYLDARAHHGKWLVRMEDIDPPREQPKAADQILKALDVYGLHWDDSVLFQSDRSEAYDDALDALLREEKLYPCTCTRKKLAGLNGVYPGYCRHRRVIPSQPHGLRLLCNNQIIQFQDRIQGDQSFALNTLGDFILKRKDGLYAYQLAVCIDDNFQGVTHIVRGVDILDSTPRQLYLQSQLHYPHPVYAHIPVITRNNGNKLSKQNHAPAIPLTNPRPLMIKALTAFGLKPEPELLMNSVEEILSWGIKHWSMRNMAGKKEIFQDSL